MNPDRSDLKGVIDSFHEHLVEANQLGRIFLTHVPEINKVYVCGMGGSGIGPDLIKSIIKIDVPLIPIKDYNIPEADERTLVIFSSYSGNTEEPVSCYLDARAKNCKRVVMSSGGVLQKLAQKDHIPHVKLPSGLQPRAALPYLFVPLFHILHSYKLIPNPERQLKYSSSSIKVMLEHRHGDIERMTRALSKKLIGKVPIIYASSALYPLAYRWKTQFNENSKIPSFSHSLSEMDHNELVGFTKTLGNYHLIFLVSDSDHERIKRRVLLTKRYINHLSQGRIDSTVINLSGNSLLTQLLFGIHLGDLTSYYLALWYMIDPTPVTIIEQLKKDLGVYPPKAYEE